MANLGTLWFGADIDLSNLKRKLQEGNREALNALKVDYDQSSYTQMVSKLKTALANERFEVKISTNVQSAVQSVKDSMTQVGKGGIGTAPLRGMAAMTNEILNQKQAINDFNVVADMYKKKAAEMARVHGFNSRQAVEARREEALAREQARAYSRQLAQMNIDKQRASLHQREHNKTMNQASAATRQLNSDSIRLNTTLANGVHISTQLGSALSSIFAIDAARQLLGNVIEIGGQLEKQRISIGAILGDTAKANHLFEQIKGLALKSPFGVVELDQYTKQLSAYGFKYNELFDMTKRLADISAGAGQDIGRLTLALGHVRSATYLTGITLRQFSMNNIPMLKMLADYYTELEGKIVSTAEVQKRISKRQVSYEDVIEQIRRLTNEGGMFYNMQEKISESLSAKYKNLRDAMDIMYGEMAEGNVGDALKDLASVLLSATRHWREIATVTSIAGMAFLVGKARIGAQTLAMQSNTAATIRQITATKQAEAVKLRQAAITRTLTAQERGRIITANQLTAADYRQALASGQLTKEEFLRLVALKKLKIAQAMHVAGVNGITAAEIRAAAATSKWKVALQGMGVSLKTAFSGIGAGTWATIGLMVGAELYSAWSNWVDRIDEKAEEMKDTIKSRIIDLDKIRKTIKEEWKPNDQLELRARVTEMKQVLANSEAYTVTLDEQLKKASGLNEQYEILAKAIDDVAEKNLKALDAQDKAADLIKASKSDFSWWDVLTANVWNDAGKNIWNQLFNEDIKTNIGDVNDAYKQLRQTLESLYEYKEPLREMINDMAKSGEVSKETAEALKDAPLEEQLRILVQNGYWDKIQEKIKTTGKYFSNTEKEIEKDCENLKKSLKNVADNWMEIADDDVPKMLAKLRENFDGDEKRMREWALNNIDDFRLMMDGVLDQINEKQPHIRRKLKEMVFDYISFGKMTDGSVTLEQQAQAAADTMAFINKNWKSQREEFLREEKLADLKDDTPKSGGDTNKGSKKDKQLEEAKTRLSQYKAFLAEYKKYRELYGKEKAINMLENLFPDLKDEKGKFLGAQLVDNYTQVLDKLRKSMPATTEARKKFINEIDKTKADTLFDREKESIQKNAKAMEEYIKKMEKQWKLYQSLLDKSGGNRDFAKLAFTDGEIWDERAKSMKAEFEKRGNELGVIPVGFHWKMDESQLEESLKDANGATQKGLVGLAKEIQEIVRGNYEQFLKDTSEAYSKALSETEKLAELQRKRNEQIKAKAADNDKSPERQKAWNIQIDATDREIQSQTWKAFKETEEWGRIFSNLDNISTQTLNNMLENLRQIAPKINESVQDTKALYEAIDKIQDKLAQRNPFEAMRSALENSKRLDFYKNEARSKGPIIANDELAKLLKVKVGTIVTELQIDDQQRDERSKFAKGLNELSNKFKAVQDALTPVIDLFNELGMTELGTLFQMGGNALGAAAQMGQGAMALFGTSAGPWGAAIGAGLSVVTSLFAMHDASLQREIEASQQRQKEMEYLTKNLETALSRTLGGVYNTKASDSMLKSLRKEISNPLLQFGFGGQYKSHISKETKDAVKEAEKTKTYYDAAYASLLAQRDELQHQMNLEDDKKDSDSGKIADMKQQLVEMEDQIEHFAEDMAKALYDIDVKSWASELGDALFEAWQKGEDGAEAFKKKASEIIANVAKKIAVTKLIETAMKPVLDVITSEMKATDGKLNEQSIAKISEQMAVVGQTLPGAFNSLMDALDEGLKKGGLDSMKEDAKKDGSISNTIKGITEDTAGLLASYINAIRADVSVNRQLLTTSLPTITYDINRISVLSETQVTLQQQIATNTQRNAESAAMIYELLRRVEIGGGALHVK